MIGIFQGRELDKTSGRIFAQIDVKFRGHIAEFNNGKNLNALGVFLVLALHADQGGWSYPGRDLIIQETGISTEKALSASLAWLRNMRIDGQRVLAHYRVHTIAGWGRSAYLIFPDLPHPEPPFPDMVEYNPKLKAPDMETVKAEPPHVPTLVGDDRPLGSEETLAGDHPPVGDPPVDDHPLKEEPVKEEPLLRESQGTNENALVAASLLGFLPGPGQETKNASAEKALLSGIDNGARQIFERADWPEQLWPWLEALHDTWGLLVPEKPEAAKRRGSRYLDWLADLPNLQHACGEYGTQILEAVHRDWTAESKHVGHAAYIVSRPGSLIKVATSKAANFRASGEKPRKQSENGKDIADLVRRARAGEHVSTT